MTKTITRADLAEAVYRKIGISQSECGELVDEMLEEIAAALEDFNKVKLSSFGTFSVRHKKMRIGRNPKTKQEVPITPRNVISFHASNVLMKKVNTNNSLGAKNYNNSEESDSGFNSSF